jgi:hypothetical protein
MDLPTSINNAINNTIAYMNKNIAYNPMLIFGIVVIIIILLIISLGMSEKGESSNLMNSTNLTNSTNLSRNIIFMIFIVVTALFVIWYFYNTSINAYVKNMFSHNPEIDIVVDHHAPPTNGTNGTNTNGSTTIPEIKFRKQVFNIPGNEYTYDNATALCKAYGSELATYKQVEDAYENGGEWCNYGWSQGQMALFPTQQSTFDRLQTIKGHEHDCGRPGVNGGYIANPNVRFGVNCYGYKPKINEEEQQMMQNVSPYPQTMEDIEMQKRVDYWKNHVNDILVSPFNREIWGEL